LVACLRIRGAAAPKQPLVPLALARSGYGVENAPQSGARSPDRFGVFRPSKFSEIDDTRRRGKGFD